MEMNRSVSAEISGGKFPEINFNLSGNVNQLFPSQHGKVML